MSFFSSLSAEVAQEVQNYHKLFSLAENACKRVELLCLEGVLFPAVNELRYAGFHLKLALVADSEKDVLKEIRLGQDHAGRAGHDAYDALAIFYIEQCDVFIEEFKTVSIPKAYPGYLTDLGKLQNARRALADAYRKATVELDLAAKEAQVDLLEEVYNNFEIARGEANKLKDEAQVNARRHAINSAVGLAALLFAALACVAAWLGLKS